MTKLNELIKGMLDNWHDGLDDGHACVDKGHHGDDCVANEHGGFGNGGHCFHNGHNFILFRA